MSTKSKICVVCGEWAKGNNFGVITCQSCKAFFRRNANKSNRFKCESDENCNINVLNRKSCKKCRLNKCFAVGMRKEWILNEEERHLRRKQIEENRIRKLNKSYTSSKPIKGTVSQESDDSSDSSLSSLLADNTINSISDEEMCEYIMQIENFCSNESVDENDINITNGANSADIPFPLSLETIVDSLDIYETNAKTNEQIVANFTEVSNSSESNATNESENLNEVDSGLEMALIIHPSTHQPLTDLNSLNKHEFNCLKELLSALSQMGRIPFMNCNVNSVRNAFNSVEELMNYSINKFDAYIAEIIATIKRLSGFQSICFNDQIALVKYGCMEIKMLRAALFFNYEYQCWAFEDNNDTIKLNLNLFKSFKENNTYNVLKKYLLRVANELDCDQLILILLMPIILFNPERPHIMHKEVIILQQQIYVYILQRYLRIKYGSESKVKTKFLRIFNVLHDIQKLQELHRQNFKIISPDKYGPLLKEILDVPATYTALCA